MAAVRPVVRAQDVGPAEGRGAGAARRLRARVLPRVEDEARRTRRAGSDPFARGARVQRTRPRRPRGLRGRPDPGARDAGDRRDAVPSRVLDRPVRAVVAAPGGDRARGHESHRAPHGPGGGAVARDGGLVRAGGVRRARRQRGPPASQPVEPPGTQRVRRRGRARGDDTPGGVLRGGRPRVAVGDRGGLVPLGRQLPPAAAASLVGAVGVLGAGEPRGRPAVRHRYAGGPPRRGEPGDQTGRRLGQPVPGPRRDRGRGARRARTRPAAPRTRHGRSRVAVGGGAAQAQGRAAPVVARRGDRRSSSARAVLREAMGDMLFDSFVATRKGELAAFEGLDDDAVVRAHRWRY